MEPDKQMTFRKGVIAGACIVVALTGTCAGLGADAGFCFIWFGFLFAVGVIAEWLNL